MKQNFNKYLSLAVAAMALCACDNIVDLSLEDKAALPGDYVELKADIADNVASKTILSQGSKVFWESGDAIAVFVDGAVDASIFSLTDGAGTSSGTFAGTVSGDSYIGVYPLAICGTASGGAVSVTLPSEQTWRDGSFGNGDNPMFARGGASMSFRNACALLKLSLTGHHSVQRIVFQSANSSVKVSGPANVSFDSSDNPVLQMGSEAEDNVILKTDGLMLDNTPKEVYIVLPPQTYSGGFSVRIETSSGSMTKTLGSDFTMQRAKIHDGGTIAVSLDEGVEPSLSLQGSGTYSDPYIIGSLPDLLFLQGAINASASSYTNSYFLQTADIDLTPVCSAESGRSWIPIGDYSSEGGFVFSGHYDGGGHSITGLYINGSSAYQGLWGRSDGWISNVSVNGDVTAGENCGIVAGQAKYLEGCTASGTVYGYDGYCGGVAGQITSSGKVSACRNYATVVSYYDCTGGIAGMAYSSIDGCINYGNISSNKRFLGGVAGVLLNSTCSMSNCVNYGSISGSGIYIGGVAGTAQENATMANCVNKGSVYTNNGYPGGVCGVLLSGSVRNCVNVGSVSESSSASNKGYVAGVIAYAESATISNCYWLYDSDAGLGIQTSVAYSSGCTTTNLVSLTDAQMKGADTGTILYTSPENKNYSQIFNALNAWAYANQSEKSYLGWVPDSGDAYPVLGTSPAEAPAE